MNYYVDTHCHLDLFPGIRTSVPQEDILPIKTITVTNTPTLWAPNQKLFKECRNIRVALGLHPELASQRAHEVEKLQAVCAEAKYIGEIGLDGTSPEEAERRAQLSVFRSVLSAIKLQEPKILTVHSRGAARETIGELIKAVRGTQHQVILHWYSGGSDELRQAVEAGFYFSINHKMVASRNGQQIIQALPKTAVLTETDAPFTFASNITTRQQSLLKTIEGLAQHWRCQPEVAKQQIWERFGDMVRAAQSPLVDKKQ